MWRWWLAVARTSRCRMAASMIWTLWENRAPAVRGLVPGVDLAVVPVSVAAVASGSMPRSRREDRQARAAAVSMRP